MHRKSPHERSQIKGLRNRLHELKNLLDIINASPDATFLMERNGRILAANQALAVRLKIAPANLLGSNIYSFFPPELAEARRKQAEKALATGQTVSFQDQRESRFFAHHIHPIARCGSHVDRLVVFTRDITPSRRMEELLSARLRLSEAAASLTMEELLTAVLDEAEALTGSRIGFFHFVEADQQTISLQVWSRSTMAQGCRFADQERHYPVKEAGVWVDCIHARRPVIHNDYAALPHRRGLPSGHAEVRRELVVPIFREEKIVAVFGVGNKEEDYDQDDVNIVSALGDMIWDIVLRQREREALHRSEERYRMQIELALDGILLSSPEWVITSANRSLCEMLGMERKDILGRHLRDLPFTPESLEKSPFRADLLQKGETVTSDRVLIRADTTLVSVEMRTGRMPDNTYQSILRDISERKRHEQQLSTALKEKEVLLREVHHRVKNNLAAIIGLMDMQRRTLEDPGSQVILTELSNRIRSMSLVHEKLYRADSLESIDFQDYTQSMISHLRTTFGSPDIICRVDAPGVSISLDLASPCGLIVNELVTNALKYAFPEGKPRPGNQDCRVLVRLHRDNSTYTLTVADNGIGWPLGFDWTKTRTLGMVLVRMLGQHQLGGRYSIDQEEGTSITLNFTDRRKGEQSHG